MLKIGDKDRFYSKTRMSSEAHPGCELPCLEWVAGRNASGYGRFRLNNRAISAHRAAWVLNRGEIPKDMCVLHVCDNPSCVRIDHLRLGTSADNIADRNTKCRQSKGEKHRAAMRKHAARGVCNGRAKLSEDNIPEMRRMYADGISSRALGKLFGISKSEAFYVVSGYTWKHVGGKHAGQDNQG